MAREARERRRDQGPDVGAWSALLRTQATLVPLLDRELQRGAGLPLAWYDVLLELNSAPGRRLRMGDLGERAVLSRTRVSRIVDELVDAGLVCREPDARDRRASWAVLTDAGRARFRAAAPVYLAGIGRHLGGHLTADEARTVERILEKVLAGHAARTSTGG